MLKYAGMQKDNIILKMQVRTSVTVLLAVFMILLMSAGTVHAADGKVIPLTDELKKALAPLSEGVVGKVISVKVKDKRYTFFAPGVGKVAEVEGLRATAIMVINIHRANAKVLVKYPKDTTPKH